MYLFSKTSIRLTISILLVSSTIGACRLLLAQDSPTVSPVKKQSFQPSIDVSLGASGQMTFARTPETYSANDYFTLKTEKTQSNTPSAGVQATFHQSFKPLIGYNVNFGWTRLTQSSSSSTSEISTSINSAPSTATYFQRSVKTDQYELTLAYVVEGPRHDRLRTFAQLGGGGLFFVPHNTPVADQQTRPAMVFGVGMDYRFSEHLELRTEYKGLFYKMPDFVVSSSPNAQQRLFTVTNMPTVGLVYRFK